MNLISRCATAMLIIIRIEGVEGTKEEIDYPGLNVYEKIQLLIYESMYPKYTPKPSSDYTSITKPIPIPKRPK